MLERFACESNSNHRIKAFLEINFCVGYRSKESTMSAIDKYNECKVALLDFEEWLNLLRPCSVVALVLFTK